MSSTLRRLPHVAWLLVVWVDLWGAVSLANVLSGVAVAGLVSWVFVDAGPRPASPARPRAILEYLGFFVVSLVVSTWQVAKAVVADRPIAPGIIAFTMWDVSDAVVTLVANSFTLTPGTLTLDVRYDGENAILFVHVFDLTDELAVRAQLEQMMRHAVIAFGGERAVDQLEGVSP